MEMTAAFKVIISGGPGTGKTSLVNELERRGYVCIHESARKVIREELKKNTDKLPWMDLAGFSDEVFEEMQQQYSMVPVNGFCFCDRGIPDIMAYLELGNISIPERYYHGIRIQNYYPRVFVCPPWEDIYEVDEERREDFKTCEKLHAFLQKSYERNGFSITMVPAKPIEERADLILDILREEKVLKIN